jgi:ubiquitin-like 1-activating enzyme E1 A
MEDQALTDKETELYDRQIRLWGVEAQRRMRDSRLLVAGLGTLGAEVVKNVVLAGMSVTIQDDRAASASDLGGQFFLTEADVGRNVSFWQIALLNRDLTVCTFVALQRATASLERVKDLNPLVRVDVRTQAVAQVDDADLAGHSLVIAADLSAAETVRRVASCAPAQILAILFCAGDIGSAVSKAGAAGDNGQPVWLLGSHVS